MVVATDILLTAALSGLLGWWLYGLVMHIRGERRGVTETPDDSTTYTGSGVAYPAPGDGMRVALIDEETGRKLASGKIPVMRHDDHIDIPAFTLSVEDSDG